MPYCYNCGAAVSAADSFCSACGYEVGDSSPVGEDGPADADRTARDHPAPSHPEPETDRDGGDGPADSESTAGRTRGDATETAAGDRTGATTITETLAPTSAKTALSGVCFGLVIGFLFAWGLVEVGGAAVGFVGGFVGGTLLVWSRQTAHHSVATGLYVSAGVLVLVPTMFYMPIIAGADPDTLEGAGEQMGGVLGLFIWTVVFAILAAVIGLVGRAVRKRTPEC